METYREYVQRRYRPKRNRESLLLAAIFVGLVSAYVGFLLWWVN